VANKAPIIGAMATSKSESTVIAAGYWLGTRSIEGPSCSRQDLRHVKACWTLTILRRAAAPIGAV